MFTERYSNAQEKSPTKTVEVVQFNSFCPDQEHIAH